MTRSSLAAPTKKGHPYTKEIESHVFYSLCPEFDKNRAKIEKNVNRNVNSALHFKYDKILLDWRQEKSLKARKPSAKDIRGNLTSYTKPGMSPDNSLALPVPKKVDHFFQFHCS